MIKIGNPWTPICEAKHGNKRQLNRAREKSLKVSKYIWSIMGIGILISETAGPINDWLMKIIGG